MRLKTILMPAVAALLALTACAQQKKQTEMKENSNNKVLVAYFSATGTTERVAKMLAGVMDATLFEITPETPYTAADLDWTDKTSRSTVEMKD
ncbi:MAG: flavodoxin, partial [Muribaculaceae bacterium]|nr:flavodoxin [Muribaculaceae bacterium]